MPRQSLLRKMDLQLEEIRNREATIQAAEKFLKAKEKKLEEKRANRNEFARQQQQLKAKAAQERLNRQFSKITLDDLDSDDDEFKVPAAAPAPAPVPPAPPARSAIPIQRSSAAPSGAPAFRPTPAPLFRNFAATSLDQELATDIVRALTDQPPARTATTDMDVEQVEGR